MAVAPSGLSPARHHVFKCCAPGESFALPSLTESGKRISTALFQLDIANLSAIPGFSELVYSIRELSRF